MTNGLLALISAILYAGLALHAWNRSGSAYAYAEGASTAPRSTDWWNFLVPLALVLHGIALYRSMFDQEVIHLGLGNALSLIVWLTVLVYWLGNLRYGINALQTLILPVAAIAVLIPIVLPSEHAYPYGQYPAFRIHLIISMLAYSLFTIGALHALLMASLEKRLHVGTLPLFLRNLPPLIAMEALLFRILTAGFLLLTLTLASGIFFSEAVFGKPLRFTHKNVFALLSWGVFAMLLVGRRVYGWRGRIATRWTLIGFGMLLLAYVGTKIVFELILQRVPA